MSGGFYVDFTALREAAEGVNLNAMATRKVSDIDAPKVAFGHDGLAGVVGDFCDRWEIGVEHRHLEELPGGEEGLRCGRTPAPAVSLIRRHPHLALTRLTHHGRRPASRHHWCGLRPFRLTLPGMFPHSSAMITERRFDRAASTKVAMCLVDAPRVPTQPCRTRDINRLPVKYRSTLL